MKKAILFSSIFAIGAAVAVDSDNAIGVATIDPTDKGDQKLVAVPFDGYVDGAVNVSDLVSPTGLAEGSKLYVVVNNGYAVWNLSKEGDWVSANVVSIGKNGVQSEVATSFEADKVTVKRGDAFWLEPATGSATTAYLLGQMPDSISSGSVTTSAGKWNYIGNPLTVKATLSGSFASGDVIIKQTSTGVQKNYTYGNDAWNSRSGLSKTTDSAISLQPGEGCWFKGVSAREISFASTSTAN